MLTIQVRGLEQALAKVDGVGPRVHAALVDTVQRETFELQRHVVQDKLSGQVLNRRSGALSRSITARVTETGGEIRGTVFFRKRTLPHVIRMPERSFLRSALADRRDAIVAAIRAAIASVLG